MLPRLGIDRILHPRSIAVFGASEDAGKFGGRIMHFLIRHRFDGDIHPINPNRASILERKAYASIADVPTAPDVAIVAVPVSRMRETVEGAAAAGVGCCVIITTGFAEADEAGLNLQAALVEVSARTGMRIVGPNCMGFIVPHHRMALCSSVVLNTDSLGDGSIGMISQSGALMVSEFDRARTAGIGLRYGVSVGNQSDLELCDFLEFMVDEPETKAICLYVEGLLDGARFRRAAARCRQVGKPLIVLKTGRTAAGVVAAKSHTASLAGSWEVFEAICRDEGIVIARDPDDMMRTAHVLASFNGRRPGHRVGVLSSSGGGASIASDRITEIGLELAPLAEATFDALGTMLLAPQARNPVDLGGRKVPADVEIAGTATATLFADPTVDIGIAFLMSMPFYQKRCLLIADAVRECGKPVLIVCTPGAAADPARQALRERGFVVYEDFEQALRVLALVADHDRMQQQARTVPVRPDGLPGQVAASTLPAGALGEQAVKELLAAYGIPVARETIVHTPEACADAAALIGFPIVLKAVSPDIVHKSDAGAVRVGLADRAAVVDAAREMLATIAERLPGAKVEGFSVQEMVRGEAEVIVGIRGDAQFGPVVMLGLGGIAVEILGDVALVPAPVAAADVGAMIARLRTAPLFHGARGRAPLDTGAIADAVERISWLAADLGTRLVDLEVNPLIVKAADGGVMAVDGRATLA